MNRFVNCIAHISSDGQLLIGDDHTALFDCGMMFCGDKTIQNVKKTLNGRSLDYLFMSHTHYDHIGALPLFRNEWMDLRTVTCEAGAAVLLKETPRRVIRELSLTAAKTYNTVINAQYDDNVFKADIIVEDTEVISLGGLSVKVIYTPGHTRDSLSFFIPELEILIVNETPGILMPDDKVYPLYLTSYNDTINSIHKCCQYHYKYISMPHKGVASAKEADGFFEKALVSNTICRDFILDMKNQNYTEEKMLNSYFIRYASEALLSYQPKDAFYANARATIASTIKELSA